MISFSRYPIAALLTWTLCRAATDGTPPTGAEQVRLLQDDLINAYIHHDVAALNRILADDYTFVTDRGAVETKEEVVANFKAGGDRTITKYEIHDPRVKVYGDAAVLVYSYTSTEQYRGVDESGDYRITRVFIRSDGTWRIVAGHETRLPHQGN